ncbi:Hypothetical protein Bbr_0452 [Bifidobacterium breve UCC2003]|nr:Hypothetical protein Bbr_0452 [Bifidobacterium breve UCC2003]
MNCVGGLIRFLLEQCRISDMLSFWLGNVLGIPFNYAKDGLSICFWIYDSFENLPIDDVLFVFAFGQSGCNGDGIHLLVDIGF